MKNSITSLIVFILLLMTSCNDKKSEPKTTNTGSVTKMGKADTSTTPVATRSAPPLAAKIDSAAETEDFKVTVPEGWSQKANKINGYKMFFLIAPKTGIFQSNVNILKDKAPGKSLDNYVSDNLKKMASMHVKKTSEGDININGITGKTMSYLYNYQGNHLSIKTYVLQAGSDFYVLTTTSPVSEAKALDPVFVKIVNSFKLR